jgi:hypothetical protein
MPSFCNSISFSLLTISCSDKCCVCITAQFQSAAKVLPDHIEISLLFFLLFKIEGNAQVYIQCFGEVVKVKDACLV